MKAFPVHKALMKEDDIIMQNGNSFANFTILTAKSTREFLYSGSSVAFLGRSCDSPIDIPTICVGESIFAGKLKTGLTDVMLGRKNSTCFLVKHNVGVIWSKYGNLGNSKSANSAAFINPAR